MERKSSSVVRGQDNRERGLDSKAQEFAKREGSERLRAAKKALRGAVQRQAAALPPDYLAEADIKITARLLSLPAYRAAQCIFCYVSVEGEPDTRELLTEAFAAGKSVAVPRCLGGGIMEAVPIRSLEDLTEAGAYGIPEPDKGLPALSDEAAVFDLCIVPCVACDREGRRLGHGMGYYDRFLEREVAARGTACRAPEGLKIVSLCYERLLQERIPTESHDRPLDAVLSEVALYRRK